MTIEKITLAIDENIAQTVVATEQHIDGIHSIEINKANLYDTLLFLKEHEEFQFNFLTSMSGVHNPDLEGRELCMVYHLHSWTNNVRLRLKVFMPIDEPYLPTITPIWPAANWMEREAYDFYGFVFSDHPNLKRILNVDEMEVFPMRKEYALEDGTRTDKVDSFFGRSGNTEQTFD